MEEKEYKELLDELKFYVDKRVLPKFLYEKIDYIIKENKMYKEKGSLDSLFK